MMRLYAAEDRRIRGHLAGALALLRSADPSPLGRAQRRNRAGHIAALDQYMRAGRYPRNLAVGGPRLPALVDPFGTRCALAHLVERSGGEELIDRLRSVDNHAFVRDLAGDQALLAWLEEAGLSAAEAARIQPSYTPPSSPFLCACRELGAAPVLLGRVETRNDDGACEVVIDEVLASPKAAPGSTGEGAPPIASTLHVHGCRGVAPGAQVLVTPWTDSSAAAYDDLGHRLPNALRARPVVNGKVTFEACFPRGAARDGSSLPDEVLLLAKLRAAQPLELAGCMEAIGAPAELIPVPHAPRRRPRPSARDRSDANATTTSSERDVAATTPSGSSAGYYYVFGGMMVAGAALAVVWVRLRTR